MLKRLKKGSRKKRFLEKASSGNIKYVVEYLKKNPRAVDFTTTDGSTALHLSSKAGHLGVVTFLLSRGTDAHKYDQRGQTATYVACEEGHVDVVKALLSYEADADLDLALLVASEKGFKDVVECLLEQGNISSKYIEKAMQIGVQEGHCDVVVCLLQQTTRLRGVSALHQLATLDNLPAAELLIANSFDVNSRSNSGFTALHYAVHFENMGMLKLLIEKGADVDAKSKSGISALHVAANEGREGLVDELIMQGADVSSKTNEGLTALHCAVKHGRVREVGRLVEGRAEVEGRSVKGFTAFHTAVQHACLSCASLLLQHGASITAVNVDGFGPLHISSYFNQISSVQFLLDKKCDINAKTHNGLTALEIARKLKHYELARLLQSHGAVAAHTLSHQAKSLPFYQALSSNQEPIRALKENVTEYAETCIEPFEEQNQTQESIEAEINKLLCEEQDIKEDYKTTKTKTTKIVMRKRIRKQRVLDGDKEHTLTSVECSMDDLSQLPCHLRHALFRVQQEFLEETRMI